MKITLILEVRKLPQQQGLQLLLSNISRVLRMPAKTETALE